MTKEQENETCLKYHKSMLRKLKSCLESFTVFIKPTKVAKGYINHIKAQIKNHEIGIKAYKNYEKTINIRCSLTGSKRAT